MSGGERTFRYARTEPLWYFGAGGSYAAFVYSGMAASPAAVAISGSNLDSLNATLSCQFGKGRDSAVAVCTMASGTLVCVDVLAQRDHFGVVVDGGENRGQFRRGECLLTAGRDQPSPAAGVDDIIGQLQLQRIDVGEHRVEPGGVDDLGSLDADRQHVLDRGDEVVDVHLGDLHRIEMTEPFPERWSDYLIEMLGDYVF